VPPPETLLDRTAERASRWLAERSSRQSRLGRVGDAALARMTAPVAPPAPVAPAPPPVAPPPVVAPVAPPPVAVPEPPVIAPLSKTVSAVDTVLGKREDGGSAVFDQEVAEPEAAAPVEEDSGAVVLPSDSGAAAAAISAHRFAPGTASAAVLVAPDPLLVAVAVPIAAVIKAPVLLADHPATEAELARLGPATLYALGVDVEGADRIDQAGQDAAAASIAAAEFVRHRAGTVRAFCIGATEQAQGIAGPVAAAAAARRYPVMIGCDAARQGAMEGERRAAVTYLVGRDAIAGAAHVPGGFPLPAPADEQVPARLSQLLKADKAEPDAAAVTSPDAPPLLKAVLAASGGVVLYQTPADPPATLYRTA
jgi:hypothetical protein